MWRKFYYLLPPGWRHIVRYFFYLPGDLVFRHKESLSPPRRLIYTGRGDFIRQGKEWLDFFIKEGGLRPHSKVLDIGSGIGRIALPMVDYLQNSYEGFDAIKTGVVWCQKNISTLNSNFKFQFIDLQNDLYKSKGNSASEFIFPYAEHSFDFICAISVFTHLQPEETENYFRQIKRVLKPGGHAVLTFFLLDDETLELMHKNKDRLQFNHHFPNYSLMDLKVKAANVAYQRSYVYELIVASGLKFVTEIKGSWCGREKTHYLDFQDILIIKYE